MKATVMLNHAAIAGTLALLTCHRQINAFAPQPQQSIPRRPASSTKLFATIQPSESTTIGTVGSGYLPILLAKLAAHRNHGKSWIICPAADMDTMRQLSSNGFGDSPSNLELVPASDTDRVEELLATTDAMLLSTDDVDSVIDPSILDYLLDPDKCQQMKRVVAMSRNLNGSGMGFLVSASKKAANAQVWDNSNRASYAAYETNVQRAVEAVGADWTIVRAGTLKGGAGGEGNVYPQYLDNSFYELTKNDIITWQLLFDCNVRGVTLARGDVQSGPGVRAVFTATDGDGANDGDSGRCGVAEAMVRSLEVEETANVDFGVGTAQAREVPSEEEWESMFREVCLK
mmetsp:Transcript_16741/g.35387  ORF Transcript_16741/g.35387 Transcript_16741/m.35387 type:complete len:344 (-) Transcript_16741:315-1346(-)